MNKQWCVFAVVTAAVLAGCLVLARPNWVSQSVPTGQDDYFLVLSGLQAMPEDRLTVRA